MTGNAKSVWDQYREHRSFTIELDDLGLTGCWVRVLPNSALTSPQYEYIFEPKDALEQQRRAFQVWIQDWNLPDLNGKPLPIPAKSDAWRKVLPGEVINYITAKVVERDKEIMEGNPLTASALSQLSEAGEPAQSG